MPDAELALPRARFDALCTLYPDEVP
jgi:hypothetical protein